MGDEVNHYAVVTFWERALKDGPLCLTKQHWRSIDYKLDETSRKVLQRLIESIEEQSRWVDERTREMRDESERVALLGRTMQRAGLRSYTDEKGRIYVAAPMPGDSQKGNE